MNQYATLGPHITSLQRSHSDKMKQLIRFYNRILKLAHQCNFSDIDECLIDAIIFGTNCVKAQDKLLQTPKMLSLQQCLTVCRHYESLKLHIQQIRPGSSKYIELLKKCHPKKKPGSSQNNQKTWQSRSQMTTDTKQQFQSHPQRMNKTQRKCYGCSRNLHKDRANECPAWGHNCRKCNRLNHWESVCGQIPSRR